MHLQAQDISAQSPERNLFLAKSSTPSEWKTISSAILSLVEEATFEVTSEGISFRAMDPSHVALIDLFWPSNSFVKFECQKPDRFTVRVEDFAKLIKRSDAKDSLEVSRSGNESLGIRIGEGAYKREFELHLLESSAKASPLPKLAFDTRFVLSYSALAQALNDVSALSNHVTIKASGERVAFSGKGDAGKALASLEKGKEGSPVYELETKKAEGSPEETSATYNIEYLLKIVKAIGASASETVKLEYSSKMPLRMEFGLGEKAGSGAVIHFYLAPRVTSE